MPVASIFSPGGVTILAVVLIVLALVYYLVSTILQLRKITAGLDEVIVSVGEIIEKSAPVNDVVNDINANLDAGVDLLEGLLVKKAGLADAVGLVEGLYPGAAAAGLRNFPDSDDDQGAAHRRGLHEGHAHARAARPRGPDRHGQPGGPGAAERRGRAASPRARCTRTSVTRARRSSRGRRSSAPTHRSSTSSGTTSARRADASRRRRPSPTIPERNTPQDRAFCRRADVIRS